MSRAHKPRVPQDPWEAFAFLVAKCAEGFGKELLQQGRTETQARNTVIGCFLNMAAGEACRIARREGREPDPEKWRKATEDAFERAAKRTVLTRGRTRSPRTPAGDLTGTEEE